MFFFLGKAKGKKKKEKEEKKKKLKIQKKDMKDEKKKKREISDDDVTPLEKPPTPMPSKPVDPFNQPPPQEAIDMATQMKDRLLAQIEQLGSNLPPNTLDQLIDELGGPENVAEMTGRKGRVVQNDNGQVQYESRSETDVPLEILNVREKERFMNGEKDVAIISEAASSGISLQVCQIIRKRSSGISYFNLYPVAIG